MLQFVNKYTNKSIHINWRLKTSVYVWDWFEKSLFFWIYRNNVKYMGEIYIKDILEIKR